MAYRVKEIAVAISNLQSHSPNVSVFNWFLYSFAACDRISIDSASRGLSAVAELLVL